MSLGDIFFIVIKHIRSKVNLFKNKKNGLFIEPIININGQAILINKLLQERNE